MAEILGIAASIAGLISLAQNLVVPLARFLGNAKSAANEVSAAVDDIRSLCGVLCVLQPVIERIDNRGFTVTQTREALYFLPLSDE
jgi:hypothetical protein